MDDSTVCCPHCEVELVFRLGQNECPQCGYNESHRIPPKNEKVRPSKIRDLVDGIVSTKDKGVTRGRREHTRTQRPRRQI